MAQTADLSTPSPLELALVGVHYHSLGRQLQLTGAPAVLLPPDLEPLPLEDALAIVLEAGVPRQREAAWTLLRGTAPPPLRERTATFSQRYRRAVRDYAQQLGLDLEQFDSRRDTYRREARLFAAALSFFAVRDDVSFNALLSKARPEGEQESSFSTAVRRTGALGGDTTTFEYLDYLNSFDDAAPAGTAEDSPKEKAARLLRNLEDEVGVSLDTYIGAFADAVAFQELWSDLHPNGAADVTVYPAYTVATQDSSTLTTSVISTALVNATRLDQLTPAIDPRNWCRLSKSFRSTRYVEDGFSLDPLKEQHGHSGPPSGERLLLEDVHLYSRDGRRQMGFFLNVLRVETTVDAGSRKATLKFSLYRSIRSRFLWDERPGGILVDEGSTKIRHVAPELYRITTRKVLRFADRTAASNWDGPLDFGQALNYLAPSALSAWIEGDIYSGVEPETPQGNIMESA